MLPTWIARRAALWDSPPLWITAELLQARMVGLQNFRSRNYTTRYVGSGVQGLAWLQKPLWCRGLQSEYHNRSLNFARSLDACAQCAFLVALLCIPNKQITKIRLFWLYTLATSGFAKASLYQHSRASVYIDPVARIGSLQQNPASHYRNSARFRGGSLYRFVDITKLKLSMKVPWIVMIQSFKHPAVLASSQDYLQRIAISQVGNL